LIDLFIYRISLAGVKVVVVEIPS